MSAPNSVFEAFGHNETCAKWVDQHLQKDVACTCGGQELPSRTEPVFDARTEETLTRLQGASVKLNAASDALNAQIKIVDKALAVIAPGVEAWIDVDRLHEGVALQLGYGKYQGAWGLLLRIKGERPVWRLSQAPRPYRIAVIGALPTLLEFLVGETDRLVTRTREAVVIAESYADAISQGVGRHGTDDATGQVAGSGPDAVQAVRPRRVYRMPRDGQGAPSSQGGGPAPAGSPPLRKP